MAKYYGKDKLETICAQAVRDRFITCDLDNFFNQSALSLSVCCRELLEVFRMLLQGLGSEIDTAFISSQFYIFFGKRFCILYQFQVSIVLN